MFFKTLVIIGICFIHPIRSQNDESNITTVNVEHQIVEEHTVISPMVINVEEPVQRQEEDPVIERSSHYTHVSPKFQGFWKKKFAWRSRWVKTWKEKKIYVAVWKKMWGPVMVNEWVPIPKPPPGWVPHGIGHGHQRYYVKTHP